MFSPAHYMKQFHAEHADPDALQRAVKAASLPDWPSLFLLKNNPMLNPEVPTTAPWKPQHTLSARQVTLERNPYYFGVDTDGNQLPYIDRIQATLTTDPQALTLNAAAGKFDFQWRDTRLSDYPVYQRNRGRGRYGVRRWATVYGTEAGLFCNQSYDEDAELAKWLRTREFRYAISMGIDREQLNEAFWLGSANRAQPPQGPTAATTSGPNHASATRCSTSSARTRCWTSSASSKATTDSAGAMTARAC